MIPADKKMGSSEGLLANVAMLRGRQAEIEQAILACVRATPDWPGDDDPERLSRLHAVVAGVVDHGLEHVEQSEERHAGKHTAERVGRLLAGETTNLGDLDYGLQAWHVGVIATGLAQAKRFTSSLPALTAGACVFATASKLCGPGSARSTGSRLTTLLPCCPRRPLRVLRWRSASRCGGSMASA